MAQAFGIWRMMGLALIAATLTGCTIKDTKAPPLQGPSELSLSFAMSATPDVLTQDGASQSLITIQTRDANGQPARGITFRLDTTLDGFNLADFGSLSARTLVTDANGRATVIYTAPISAVPMDEGRTVNVQATPFGSDFANSRSRQVTIRLIPPGVLLPGGPSPPTPSFTITPNPAAAFTDVQFNASGWIPAPGTQIRSYDWNFGDGGTGSGMTVFHQFEAGSYIVTLTVTDTNGVTATVQQSISVGAGSAPIASFVFSPSAPGINQDIFFNARSSTPGAGRTIVRYDWDFGSGAPRTGLNVTKSYDVAGTYNVVLTVTDDVGQTGTATQTVTVGTPGTPGASFTFSPTSPIPGQSVNFNASSSTGPIIRYDWDFGDGFTSTGNTTPTTTHSFIAAGTYIVRLSVTDSAGNSNATTQNVTVTAPVPPAPPVNPVAAFTYSPANPTAGSTVFFDASTTTTPSGAPINNYRWNFGDGTIISGFAGIPPGGGTYQAPNHIYLAAGSYSVTLIVTDTNGNVANATQTVVVLP